MKMHSALEIISKEIETIPGLSHRFYMAIGFILGSLEDRDLLSSQIDLKLDELIVEDK